MRHSHWKKLAVLLSAVLLLDVSPQPASAADDPTLEAILKAWRKRQAETKTVRVAWTDRLTYTTGSYVDAEAAEREESRGERGIVLPPTDITFDESSVLTLNHEKIRLASEGNSWGERGELIPTATVSFFDGKLSSILNAPWGDTKFPSGSVQEKEGRFVNGRDVPTWPILLFYRALDPAVAVFHPEKGIFRQLAVSRQRPVLEGHTCLVLDVLGDGGEVSYSFWLDPEMDYAIRRNTFSVGGTLSRTLDIRYVKDARHGWVPHAWDMVTVKPDGRFSESRSSTVRDYSVNEPVPSDESQLVFPAGTLVMDANQKTYYLLREGGKRRYVAEDEYCATYEQFLNSETGQAFKPARGAWTTRLLWIGSLALAAMVCFLVIRRRRQQAKAVQP